MGFPSVDNWNGYPFGWHGMEMEPVEAGAYWAGSGFYDPYIQQFLSGASAIGTSAPNGGFENFARPSTGSGRHPVPEPPSGPEIFATELVPNTLTALSGGFGQIPFGKEEGIPSPIPLKYVFKIFSSIFDFFGLFDGGGGSPFVPRKRMHGAHPGFALTGINDDLTPTQASSAPPPPRAKIESQQQGPGCGVGSIEAFTLSAAVCGAGIAMTARGQVGTGRPAAVMGCTAAIAIGACCAANVLGKHIDCPSDFQWEPSQSQAPLKKDPLEELPGRWGEAPGA